MFIDRDVDGNGASSSAHVPLRGVLKNNGKRADVVGVCSGPKRDRWAGLLYKFVIFLLLCVVFGYIVQDRYTTVLTKLYREDPRTLLLATAVAGPNGTVPTTRGGTCFVHLEFGHRQALGALCMNPSTGYVAWQIEVYDGAYGPPLLYQLGVYGPVSKAESARKWPLPLFMQLDAVSGVVDEMLLFGLVPQPAEAIRQLQVSPRDYVIEMHAHNFTGSVGAPLPLRATLTD